MKSKIVKKWLALALAGTMALSAAACGSQAETSTSTSTGSSETTASSSGESASAEGEDSTATAERQDITFMTIDFNAGASNTGEYAEEILTQIEDYCNVNLEIEWVLSDVTEERTTLAMANPATMPMIMTWSGELTGNVVNAAKQGAFVDLSEYIWDSEKYPNLSRLPLTES